MPSSEPDRRAGSVLRGLQQHETERASSPPLVLRRYEVGPMLGEGGSAVVYRARDRELGRTVAIKVLRDRLGTSGTVRERFRREAQVASSVTHPNLVMIYDSGEEEGQLHLVMEYVDGASLEALLAGKDRGDLRSLVTLLEKAARGVAAAHAHGIVHRDLKPGNILVTAAGEPKVADFGLAHVSGAELGLTRSGSVLGTPLYMAPEQVRSRADLISPRTDVHALGAILYEILAGRPPHTGESITEIYDRIVNNDPLPPSRHHAQAPEELGRVALMALEKEPQRRHAGATEFADDLRRWLDGEPVMARPASGAGRLWRRMRRHRAATMAAAGTLVALGALATWAVVESRRNLRAREAAAEHERVEREVSALLDRGRSALERAERSLHNASIDPDEIHRTADAARPLIEEALRLDPSRSQAHYLLGRAWSLKGRDDLAEASWRRAIALDPENRAARFALGKNLLSSAYLLTVAKDAREYLSRRSRVQALSEEAALHIGRAISDAPEFDSDVQRDIAAVWLLYARGEYERVRPEAQEGIERHAGRGDIEEFYFFLGLVTKGREQVNYLNEAIARRPHFALALYARGNGRVSLGDHESGARDLEAVVRLSPRTLVAWGDLASARGKMGDFQGALEAIDQAIAIDPARAGSHVEKAAIFEYRSEWAAMLAEGEEAVRLDPGMARAWAVRAQARRKLGDLDRAFADWARAIEADPKLAIAFGQRAEAWIERGDLRAALDDFDHALALDPSNPSLWINRASASVRLGDFARAESDASRSIDLDRTNATAWHLRAIAHYGQGRFQEASADIARSLELAPKSADARCFRSALLRAMGDLPGALEDANEALRIDPGKGDARQARAVLLLALHRPQEAKGDADEAVRLLPGNPEAWMVRGMIRFALGDREGTIGDYRKTLEVAPPDWPQRPAVERELDRIQER